MAEAEARAAEAKASAAKAEVELIKARAGLDVGHGDNVESKNNKGGADDKKSRRRSTKKGQTKKTAVPVVKKPSQIELSDGYIGVEPKNMKGGADTKAEKTPSTTKKSSPAKSAEEEKPIPIDEIPLSRSSLKHVIERYGSKSEEAFIFTERLKRELSRDKDVRIVINYLKALGKLNKEDKGIEKLIFILEERVGKAVKNSGDVKTGETVKSVITSPKEAISSIAYETPKMTHKILVEFEGGALIRITRYFTKKDDAMAKAEVLRGNVIGFSGTTIPHFNISDNSRGDVSKTANLIRYIVNHVGFKKELPPKTPLVNKEGATGAILKSTPSVDKETETPRQRRRRRLPGGNRRKAGHTQKESGSKEADDKEGGTATLATSDGSRNGIKTGEWPRLKKREEGNVDDSADRKSA